MPIFDAYLMVDWSASSRPRAGDDSIWIAWGRTKDQTSPRTANLPTRKRAKDIVSSLLTEAVAANLRVLVGFDFAYAYPAGFARMLRIEEGKDSWRRVWARIADHIRDDVGGLPNANNRFEAAADLNKWIGIPSFAGPFWGRPGEAEAGDLLKPRRPDFDSLPEAHRIGELRQTDLQLKADKRPSIQSAWKLFTAGSVGSQALLGIPVVNSLVEKFPACSQVWPLQTGFTAFPAVNQSPLVLHAEIWPGILESSDTRLNDEKFVCRDEAQVFALVSVFRELDRAGELGRLFEPRHVPDRCEPRHLREEGWILGAGVGAEGAARIRELAAKAIQDHTPPPPAW